MRRSSQQSAVSDQHKAEGSVSSQQSAISTRKDKTGKRKRNFIFAKVENGQVLHCILRRPRPGYSSRKTLKYLDRQAHSAQPARVSARDENFGLKWFCVHLEYRKPLAEVLIASFVLQISPRHPDIHPGDHRQGPCPPGLTTLDVLAIGLLTIALFEGALNILRTYVFTHTTSRIDVNLGVRLFRHLFALPLRYFEVRRVGDTIARVRELENIRHFLTGSPLTLVLDLMFVFVFVAVMLFYSVKLTLAALVALPLFALLSYLVSANAPPPA